MGYRLAGEILGHCPDLPYREFRILMTIAHDARDETRQAMPGHGKLALWGNCGMRTVTTAVAGLTQRGLIKAVRLPAPGVRAVYEILPMGPATHADMVAPERTQLQGNARNFGRQRTQPLPAPTQSSIPSHSAQSDQARNRGQTRLPAPGDGSLTQIIIDEIKTATGRTIGPQWAALTARNILNGREVQNAAGYIRAAIRAEPDPRTRFLSHYDNRDQQ